MMRLEYVLIAVLIAALLGACGPAPAALKTGAPPAQPTPDPAERALAVYGDAIAGPGDGAALRRAFDQVELALAVVSTEHSLRGELLEAEGVLVARLALLDTEPGPEPATQGVEAAADEGPTAGIPGRAAPSATRAALPGSSPAPRRVPTPTTQGSPAYVTTMRKSFEGSGNSGQFTSCIDVQILGRSGPVAGAVIGINNGEHSYEDQTDQNGYSGRCGLGASTWSVVLFWTPGGGQVVGGATTVYLSGAPEQRAAVVFQER